MTELPFKTDNDELEFNTAETLFLVLPSDRDAKNELDLDPKFVPPPIVDPLRAAEFPFVDSEVMF